MESKVILIFSAALMFVGIIRIILVTRLIKFGKRTTGHVIGNNTRMKSKYGGIVYLPIFSFKTEAGDIVKTCDYSCSNDYRYEDGSELEIIYYPSSPNKARVMLCSQLYYRPIMVLLIGVVISIVLIAAHYKLSGKITLW